ncbi:MAG: class I SAM-dependent methyltransferase [candidate division SR1 bacterium]|nr:class I SAM-dependent methyltransferase [candidate division SR1 bacterium]
MGDIKDPVQVTIAGYSDTVKSYKAGRSDLSRDEENRKYFLEYLKGKKILDIGCAHGRDVAEFCKNGMEVTGIDLTPEFVIMAKESCPNATIQLMDMRDLKFGDKTFDGIWACASFLHIPKKETKKTLKGFHRVLKTGGLLFIAVIEGTGEGYDRRAKYNNAERFFSYRQKDGLEKKLRDNGFSIQKNFLNNPSGSGSTWVNIFAIAK